MNKLHVWLLKRIFKHIVKQGYYHAANIRQVYSLLREEAQKEFFEDTIIGLDHYLLEQFQAVHTDLLTVPQL